MKTARERILAILPHLKLMVDDAQKEYPESRITLSVNVNHPEGGGRMMGGFAFEEFYKDLTELVNASEITDDQLLSAKATQFVQRHGLTVVDKT